MSISLGKTFHPTSIPIERRRESLQQKELSANEQAYKPEEHKNDHSWRKLYLVDYVACSIPDRAQPLRDDADMPIKVLSHLSRWLQNHGLENYLQVADVETPKRRSNHLAHRH